MENIRTAAIVLAAGQGQRMQTKTAKQFLLLNEKPVLYYSLKAFEDSPVDEIVLVTGESEILFCQKEIVEPCGFKKVKRVVAGGKERYHSVYAGLCALKEDGGFPVDGIVLIHDGARPLVTEEIICRTMEGAREYSACVAAMPVKDTIKVSDGEQFAETTLDRSRLWQIQTPQTFRYGLVKDAYERMLSDPKCQNGVTDDAMVVETMTDVKVKLVEGSYRNLKVTTPEDMVVARAFLGEGDL